jgi:hypothetical protein
MKTFIKYMGFLIFIVNMIFVEGVGGQTIMQTPRLVNTPPQISNSISEKILETYAIDFDGDDELDFLVYIKNETSDEPIAFELWYASSFKLVKRVPKYISDYDYKWFINLDDDPEPEIISAYGFTDGVDYSIYDQNLAKGSDILLFRFNPVLIDSSNKQKEYYWGYPWDVTNIITRVENEVIRIRSSVNHDIIRDAYINIPKWQQTLPVIFFEGKTTQPDIEVEAIRKVRWLTLKEIEKAVRK